MHKRDHAHVSMDVTKREQREDTMIAQLNSLSVEARWHACEALLRAGSQKSVAPLIAILEDDRDSYARALAAKALGSIPADTRAVDPLIAALSDTNDRVRDEAVVALGSISRSLPEAGSRVVASLIPHLADSAGYWVRLHVVAVLDERGDTRAIEPLVSCLSDWGEHWEVRVQAIRALAKTGDRQAIEQVIEALRALLADDRLLALRIEQRLKIQHAATTALADLGQA